MTDDERNELERLRQEVEALAGRVAWLEALPQAVERRAKEGEARRRQQEQERRERENWFRQQEIEEALKTEHVHCNHRDFMGELCDSGVLVREHVDLEGRLIRQLVRPRTEGERLYGKRMFLVTKIGLAREKLDALQTAANAAPGGFAGLGTGAAASAAELTEQIGQLGQRLAEVDREGSVLAARLEQERAAEEERQYQRLAEVAAVEKERKRQQLLAEAEALKPPAAAV
jgi:hypothetical protein